eukprot:g13185.t1
MKFAKHLARAMDVSDPEWHPFWINYKQLKKLLKRPAVGDHPSSTCISRSRRSSGRSIATLPPPADAPLEQDAAPPPAGAPGGGATAERLPSYDGRSKERGGPSSSGSGSSSSSSSSVHRPPTPGPPPSSTNLRRPRPWEEPPPPPPAAAAAAASTPTASAENPSPQRPPPPPAAGAASPASGGSCRPCEAAGGADETAASQPEAAAPVAAGAAWHRHPTGVEESTAGGGAASGHRAGGAPRQDRPVLESPPDDPASRPPDATATAATAGGASATVAVKVPACCSRKPSSCAAAAAAAAAVAPAAGAGFGVAGGGKAVAMDRAGRGGGIGSGRGGGSGSGSGSGNGSDVRAQRAQREPCRCPFFVAMLREVDKCRIFFLDNEAALKVRTKRLQQGLDQLNRPDLSRLSSVKGAHTKLMQACVNFYRDALLLEDFAMLNYMAVIKLLKKRDKLAGTSDQRPFMATVMAEQPFAMYPGVVKRVGQVEQIFRDIEHMCFLRTGEGMKSVMKTELTVVEAMMQLAHESKHEQQKELRDGVVSNKEAPQPGSTSAHPPQQNQPQLCVSPAPVGVSWCARGPCDPTVPGCCGVRGGAGGAAIAAYAGEGAAREAARTWAGGFSLSSSSSSTAVVASRGGRDDVAPAERRNTPPPTHGAREAGSGGRDPGHQSPPRNQLGGASGSGGWAVSTRTTNGTGPAGQQHDSSSRWVLSKYAAKGVWGAHRGRRTPPLTSSTPVLPPRFSVVLSARPRDSGSGGGDGAPFTPAFSTASDRGRCAGESASAAATSGGGVGGAEVVGALGTPLPMSLGSRLAASAGVVGHGDRVSKQARLG